MTLKLLAGALIALGFSQAALADVTYTYTGAKFNDVTVLTINDPEVPPEIALGQSAAAKAILLNDQLGFTLKTPVYMPAGWTTIDYTGVYGQLAAPLATLPPLGYDASVSWTVTNTAWTSQGTVQLDNVFAYDPWLDSKLSLSVHVGAGNAIDAWTISIVPGEAWGPPTFDIAVGSSSITGDTLLYEFAANHGYQRKEAAVTTAGTWALSGSPITAVPEPGTAAMLLAGLALTGAMLRKQKRQA
jgi:hypothetical protein